MTLFAVVPVKDLKEAKSRLGAVLSPGERAELTLRTMGCVLAAIRGAGLRHVCVVSPDRTVFDAARRLGAACLPQRGRGLNPALEEARAWAVSEGASALLVLPADLPLLEPEDVEALLRANGEHPPVVISPDRFRTGTNALLLRPPGVLPFAFGEASFGRHLRLARERGLTVNVCERPNISLDLDTGEDLERLVS